jgi:hypothetical protein
VRQNAALKRADPRRSALAGRHQPEWRPV